MKRAFAALTVASLALGAGPCDKTKPVTLRILHSNDIHCHLETHPSSPFGLGGVARLATVLADRREAAGPDTTLTLDAGDWCEGTWYFNLGTGAATLSLMQRMKYDAVVVGNHDYLTGPGRLAATVRESGASFPVMAANLDLSAYPGEEDFRRAIPKTAILVRGDLRIGIIGLTTFDVVYGTWLSPAVATEPIRAAQDLARELRPLVDVLIVLSHNSFSTNIQVARSVLGVDAVVSGHSHKKVGRAVLVRNAGRDVPVVETGKWAQFLGELRLEVDRNRRVVKFEGYELHPVFPSLPEDVEIREAIDAEDARLAERYGMDIHEVVARSEIHLDHSDAHYAGLGHLAAKAYRAAVPDAKASFEVIPLTGVDVVDGDVSVMDLHDVQPHIYNHASGKEWNLWRWNARGNDLGLIINIFYTAARQIPLANAGFLTHDGIEVVWEPKHAGNDIAKVKEIRVAGEPLDLGARYPVSITEGVKVAFTLVNEKFRLGVDLSDITDTGVEAWRSMLAYGRAARVLTADGLLAGARSYTTIADPALPPYEILRDAGGLRLRVRNDGLAATPVMRARCAVGRANDYLFYGTDDEAPYSSIGEAEVGPLDPGASALVTIPWAPASPGHWPVRCAVASDVDGYAGNSGGSKLFYVDP
jgi:5'-nucleotidase